MAANLFLSEAIDWLKELESGTVVTNIGQIPTDQLRLIKQGVRHGKYRKLTSLNHPKPKDAYALAGAPIVGNFVPVQEEQETLLTFKPGKDGDDALKVEQQVKVGMRVKMGGQIITVTKVSKQSRTEPINSDTDPGDTRVHGKRITTIVSVTGETEQFYQKTNPFTFYHVEKQMYAKPVKESAGGDDGEDAEAPPVLSTKPVQPTDERFLLPRVVREALEACGGKGRAFAHPERNIAYAYIDERGSMTPDQWNALGDKLRQLGYYDGIVSPEPPSLGDGWVEAWPIPGRLHESVTEAVSADSPAFKAWFGASKVVDKSGKPLLVYHGTGSQFRRFSLKKSTMGILWFTDNRKGIEAGDVGAQGKGFILHTYLKITKGAGWTDYNKYGIGELKSQGFDGLILPDGDETTYAVFHPDQIKIVKSERLDVKSKTEGAQMPSWFINEAKATLPAVNKALKAKGYDVELVKGRGYYYFSGKDAEKFKEQGVMVPRVGDISVEDWVKEFEGKKADVDRYESEDTYPSSHYRPYKAKPNVNAKKLKGAKIEFVKCAPRPASEPGAFLPMPAIPMGWQLKVTFPKDTVIPDEAQAYLKSLGALPAWKQANVWTTSDFTDKPYVDEASALTIARKRKRRRPGKEIEGDLEDAGLPEAADEAAEYESRPAVKEALQIVKALHKKKAFGPGGSWAGYKMRLWAHFHPDKPYPGQGWNVPQEYIYAQKRVLAGWSREDAFKQVVRR